MFKLNKIQVALELQDEKDKKNTFLMGATNSTERHINNVIDSQENQNGKHQTIDVRRSMKLQMSSIFADDLKEKGKAVIGLENNCFTCSKSDNNREVLKAFKMACLTYAPSKVEFDKLTYTREELIAAKQILMDYCLG